MPNIHTLTARQFARDPAGAKRAAIDGPVFVTDRGRPTHVLLSIGDYRRQTRTGLNLADALAMSEPDDVEFEPARLNIRLQAADVHDDVPGDDAA